MVVSCVGGVWLKLGFVCLRYWIWLVTVGCLL